MDEDPEVRGAAWDLYVALHNLADSQSFGPVLTSVQHGTLGDVDDVLAQLDRHAETLRRVRPSLVQQVHDVVASWQSHRADRLVRLVPVLDALSAVAGSSLPLQLPPSV
ncbi:hypothetical protein [Streptomyces sp. EAS-AB2608]|uniref:hypothetical protein n=1 Tax=Streptomyces sp. EAS-AB2608 TaxID=2779671 RepID=UPI001C842E91|nr:hypothetical protein [Streptomyces sp. EAS-AB2608]